MAECRTKLHERRVNQGHLGPPEFHALFQLYTLNQRARHYRRSRASCARLLKDVTKDVTKTGLRSLRKRFACHAFVATWVADHLIGTRSREPLRALRTK